MALNDDIALLSRVALFSDLNEDKLRLIAFGAEQRRIAEGQVLFQQGTTGDCAFVVAGGRFELSRSDRNGNPQRAGVAERGALLGEVAMISPVQRKVTAVATAPSEVIRITRPLFTRMLEEYPEIAEIVRARIAANLKATVAGLAKIEPRLRA